MDCKFITNGLSVSYDHVAKPCCAWKTSTEWSQQNQIHLLDLSTWHKSKNVVSQKLALDQDIWPSGCKECQTAEQRGRQDSVRFNGLSAYEHYQESDITLEIRPGNVCNFACQTCWPAASSRVTQFQHAAGLIDRSTVDSFPITDFDFLLPVANNIKNVVLLGGEPFYDKNCLKFLEWAKLHLAAEITLFTNGSSIDWDWLESYPEKITLVFSLDAVGKAAEYVRFGTIWKDVIENYRRCQNLKENIKVRVNITASVYNYHYLPDIMNLLTQQWPEVVSFGTPNKLYLKESVIPLAQRALVIAKINHAIKIITDSADQIPSDQWHNAINALKDINNNLKQQTWNSDQYDFLKTYIEKLDRVKNIKIIDYCPETVKILDLP